MTQGNRGKHSGSTLKIVVGSILLILTWMLANGCVATPLPTPPSVDTSQLSLTTSDAGEPILRGTAQAFDPGDYIIHGLRLTGEETWTLADLEPDNAFSASLPGEVTEIFYLEALTAARDIFLTAFTIEESTGAILPADPGPDEDGDGSPTFLDCDDDDPQVTGRRCFEVGAIYYVSNDGDDSNDGLSPTSPWQTIAHVNDQELQPSDTVLFQRGDIWRGETLSLNESGAVDAPITVAAYGSGARPRIFGSESLVEFNSDTRTNVYAAERSLPTNPWRIDGPEDYHGALFFVFTDRIEWGDHYYETIDELSENFDWTWQDGVIYFYFDGDPTDLERIECAQQSLGIEINGEHIIINGFDLQFFGNRGIGTGIYPEVTMRDLQIRNCHIAYMSVREGRVGYGIQLYHSDMVIEGNDIHDAGNRNISLVIYDADVEPGVIMENVIVQDNELHESWNITGVYVGVHAPQHIARDIIIRRNVIWEEPNNDKADYSIMMNFFQNGSEVESVDSIYFYSNFVMNAQRNGVHIEGVSNAHIVNNTFTGSFIDDGSAYALIYHGLQGSSTIMNNIFYNYSPEESTSIYISVRGATGGADTTFDALNNNLYYTLYDGNYLLAEITGGPYRQSQWSELQAQGFELDSPPPQDPLFVDPLLDLHIATGSPAVEAALPVDFVTTDIDGNPRDPETPDIGAHEL